MVATSPCGHLVQVDRIFNDVADDKVSIRDARVRLAGIQGRPALYPRWALVAATAVASGAAAVFFRGGPTEMAMAAGAGAGGIVTGILLANVLLPPKKLL